MVSWYVFNALWGSVVGLGRHDVKTTIMRYIEMEWTRAIYVSDCFDCWLLLTVLHGACEVFFTRKEALCTPVVVRIPSLSCRAVRSHDTDAVMDFISLCHLPMIVAKYQSRMQHDGQRRGRHTQYLRCMWLSRILWLEEWTNVSMLVLYFRIWQENQRIPDQIIMKPTKRQCV